MRASVRQRKRPQRRPGALTSVAASRQLAGAPDELLLPLLLCKHSHRRLHHSGGCSIQSRHRQQEQRRRVFSLSIVLAPAGTFACERASASASARAQTFESRRRPGSHYLCASELAQVSRCCGSLNNSLATCESAHLFAKMSVSQCACASSSWSSSPCVSFAAANCAAGKSLAQAFSRSATFIHSLLRLESKRSRVAAKQSSVPATGHC